MNKNVLNIVLIIVLLISVIRVKSQSEKNIKPDYSHYLGTEYKWEPDNPFAESSRVFASFGTEIASVYASKRELTVMKYSPHHKSFRNPTKIASFSESKIDDGILTFELKGVHYIVIYTNNYHGISTIQEGEASMRIYSSTDGNLEEWKIHERCRARDLPNDTLKRYIAAFTYGNKVYLAYQSFCTPSTYVDHLSAFRGYTDIRIDECTIDENASFFTVDTTYYFNYVLPQININNKYVVRKLDGFIHKDRKLRLLLSYYSRHLHKKSEYEDGKGGGVVVLDLEKNTFHTLYSNDDYLSAISCITGSIKGDKKSESDPSNSFRIQVVYNHLEKHSILRWKNTAHFYYRTYVIHGSGYKLLRKGKIELHDKMIPKSDYKLCLDLVPKFTPELNQDNNRNNDFITKNIWLFHVDKHAGLWANIFHSDMWKPDPSSYEYSTDLMDDARYGPGIRDLWTLVGITEGAPPVSMDWERWDSTHLTTTHPSTLTFSNTQSTDTKITSTFSRTWYSLTGASYSRKGVTISGSYKYTNAYQKMKTTNMSTSLKIEQDYYSSKYTQGLAYLIWSIPSVYRIKYAIYPWWDTNLNYLVDSSEAFLYYSLSNTILVEQAPKSQAPFGITNPNNSSFTDWKISNLYRDTIDYMSGKYNVPPRSLSWSNNGPGNTNTFVSTTTNTITTKQTHEHTITASLSYDVPKVFHIGETGSIDWSYEDDITLSTSISKEVKISMKNLEDTIDGSNVSAIYTAAYFFTPMKDENGKAIDWWYYKYFGNHHPWYITYLVNSVTPITVKSPIKNGEIKIDDGFRWEHEVKDEFEYSIVFSNSIMFGPEHSHEINVQNSKSLQLTDEIMDEFNKDSIIYWVVKGKSSENNYAWSDIHWFVIPKEKNYINSEVTGDINLLDFMVYPNPIQTNKLNILFKAGLNSDKINMNIYSMDGRQILSRELYSSNMNGSELIVDLPNLASGFYFVRLSSDGTSGVVKIIIP